MQHHQAVQVALLSYYGIALQVANEKLERALMAAQRQPGSFHSPHTLQQSSAGSADSTSLLLLLLLLLL